jgi:hypothetical protein
VLYERDAALDQIYFPNDSMVSLVAVVDGGDGVEVGLVGKDSRRHAPGAGRVEAQCRLATGARSVRLRFDDHRDADCRVQQLAIDLSDVTIRRFSQHVHPQPFPRDMM